MNTASFSIRSSLAILLILLCAACAPTQASNTNNVPPTPSVNAPSNEVIPTATVQAVPLSAGTITALTTLPGDAMQIEVGYAEQYFTYLTYHPQPNHDGMMAMPATLHVVDSDTNQSWEVTTGCTNYVCEFAWLSTGQLLWLEQGTVYVADGNGANKREWDAPEGMSELFGVSPTDIAVLRGGISNSLYRFYPADGTFDEVPAPETSAALVQPFVNQRDLLYFTADNSVAGLAYETVVGPPYSDTYLIALPMEKGATPILLAGGALGFDYPGRDGLPALPPMPLIGTSYWLPPELITRAGDAMPTAYVVDERTGDFVKLHDLMGLDNETRIGYVYCSPDGTWLAASLEASASAGQGSRTQELYVAPVTNLSEGLRVTGNLEGWQPKTPAIVVREWGDSTIQITHISLVDGKRTPIFTDVPLTRGGVSLATDQAFFIQVSYEWNQHAVVAPDGTFHEVSIPLRRMVYAGGGENRIDTIGAVGTHAYYFGGDPADGETEGDGVILRWDVAQ